MKHYNNEELQNIIVNGDWNSKEAFSLGAFINSVMADDEKFSKACEDENFLPVKIVIGNREFNFRGWTPAVIESLDDLAERVIDEI